MAFLAYFSPVRTGDEESNRRERRRQRAFVFVPPGGRRAYEGAAKFQVVAKRYGDWAEIVWNQPLEVSAFFYGNLMRMELDDLGLLGGGHCAVVSAIATAAGFACPAFAESHPAAPKGVAGSRERGRGIEVTCVHPGEDYFSESLPPVSHSRLKRQKVIFLLPWRS
jgi:hypothetical protein